MHPRTVVALIFLAALVSLPARPAFADQEIRSERVSFAPGSSSATVEGSIKGYESIDYLLNAGKGQNMNVSMTTDNGASYFNILAPGEDTVAMFNGSISGNRYEGTLPASGDYRIRIYLMRSAARRGEVAAYNLKIGISGDIETSR